jgi:iron complex transport system ATP-binding protein
MAEAVIELEDVCFCRKERTILDRINWRVEPGQHWALLGANGSGKTTLLKILSGYEWPTFGQVTVQGKRFGRTSIPDLRKTIGHVSSSLEHRLPGQDTAAQIVASGIDASLGLYRRMGKEDMERAVAALASLRAEGIASQSYQTLSQGEQQKVLIARGLISGPRLLILDEPCAGLDPAARGRFLKDVAFMAARPNSPCILYVTHHIEEIGPWITNVLLLKAGKVLDQGTPKEMLTSERLSALFDCRCAVRQNEKGRRLEILD